LDNRVLREVFGTGREAVTWGWRTCIWKLLDLCPTKIYLADQIEDDEIEGTCDNLREGGEKCMKYYVGESEIKCRLGRLRHRCEIIIRMDLKDVEWKDMD
jgi:hypothetical protein